MDGWPKGVNNRLRETETGAAGKNEFEIPSSPWLRGAVNVDLTQRGHPLRRTGYTELFTGFTHSLWSDPAIDYGLCVKDGWLTLVDASNGVTETQVQEVNPHYPVSYAVMNGEVYWSNGESLGRISKQREALHWGMDRSPVPGVAAIANGGMHAGTYQVAVTYEDLDEIENGACEPQVVAVATGQGVRVVLGTPPANAVTANIYLTQSDSEVFYLARSVAVGTAQVDIGIGDLGRGRLLETRDRHPPKAGHIVRSFAGRLYVARFDTVGFTDPVRYHLMQPSQGLFMFPDMPTLLEPTQDGLYVGGSFGVVFIQGTDPYNVSQTAVSVHAPVERANMQAPGAWFGVNARQVPLWWGQDGVLVAGLPGGQIRELTRDRLAVPTHQVGAMMLREREGMSHVVSVLRRGVEENNLAATDTVVAEVRKNCIKLN